MNQNKWLVQVFHHNWLTNWGEILINNRQLEPTMNFLHYRNTTKYRPSPHCSYSITASAIHDLRRKEDQAHVLRPLKWRHAHFMQMIWAFVVIKQCQGHALHCCDESAFKFRSMPKSKSSCITTCSLRVLLKKISWNWISQFIP